MLGSEVRKETELVMIDSNLVTPAGWDGALRLGAHWAPQSHYITTPGGGGSGGGGGGLVFASLTLQTLQIEKSEMTDGIRPAFIVLAVHTNPTFIMQN